MKWFSRRAIVSMINAWNVFCNWKLVESYNAQISKGDTVSYDGNIFVVEEQFVEKISASLLLFYKPVGYVCSKSDPHNATIYDILPEMYHSWYYLWRLDKDSRGLVLLTDDPKLVNHYEHPRHWITKEYLVTLHKPFSEDAANRCLSGIQDGEDLLKCIECEVLDIPWYQKYKQFLLQDDQIRQWSFVRIVLNEWKKRHIRRMMSGLRYHVEDLVRIREWDFDLGDLQSWSFREVSRF
jgi:pseudouridine synthase